MRCWLEQELEEILLEMNEKLQKGNIKEATLLRDKLEVVMEKSGFQYKPDESFQC
jgi:methanogenic corrinoid protein MtbC1